MACLNLSDKEYTLVSIYLFIYFPIALRKEKKMGGNVEKDKVSC